MLKMDFHDFRFIYLRNWKCRYGTFCESCHTLFDFIAESVTFEVTLSLIIVLLCAILCDIFTLLLAPP